MKAKSEVPLPLAILIIVVAAIALIGGAWLWTSCSRAGAVTAPLPSGREQIQVTEQEKRVLIDALARRNQRMRSLQSGSVPAGR
ncbi:MAG: hypothetical protein C4335_01590 [Armatimonadota bacterium]